LAHTGAPAEILDGHAAVASSTFLELRSSNAWTSARIRLKEGSYPSNDSGWAAISANWMGPYAQRETSILAAGARATTFGWCFDFCRSSYEFVIV
jgi:hypothetical protein